MKPNEDLNEIKVQESHRTLFSRQLSGNCKPSCASIRFCLEADKDNLKSVTFRSKPDPEPEVLEETFKNETVIKLAVKPGKMITRGIQTDFRESEAQTVPWRPKVRAENRILDELLALDSIFSDKQFFPGTKEIRLIERARQKLAWENVIERLRGRENEFKRNLLVTRIAEEEAEFKEKTMVETSEERINLSKKLMKEERERWENNLRNRLEKLYGTRRRENDKKIHRWNRHLSREVRKMKKGKIHFSKKSGKFFQNRELVDIQSRHLEKFHGLEMLEKLFLSVSLQSNAVKFDYVEGSKPKKIELCSRRYRSKVWREAEEAEGARISSFLKISVGTSSTTCGEMLATTMQKRREREDRRKIESESRREERIERRSR